MIPSIAVQHEMNFEGLEEFTAHHNKGIPDAFRSNPWVIFTENRDDWCIELTNYMREEGIPNIVIT